MMTLISGEQDLTTNNMEEKIMQHLTKRDCLITGLGLTLLALGGIVMLGFNFISLGLAIASLLPFRWAYIKHMTW